MLLIAKVVGLVLFSFLLGKITEELIKILTRFAATFKMGQFAATAIIMAMATSLPEIFVSISASLSGITDLALGNAIGSNVVNLSLVMGMTAIAGQSLHLKSSQQIKQDVGPLIYTLLPFLMMEDGRISRVEGLFLIAVYIMYVLGLIRRRQRESLREQIKSQLMAGKVSGLVLKMVFWLVMLLGASQVIVLLAKGLAVDLGLPVLLIGLFLVAVGTSLPELVFNVKAAKKRKISMSMGNIIGSCVANATLVIGLAAIIRPIMIGNIYQILAPGIEYVFVAIFVVWFAYTKHRIDAWEGTILVLLFAYYMSLAVVFK